MKLSDVLKEKDIKNGVYEIHFYNNDGEKQTIELDAASKEDVVSFWDRFLKNNKGTVSETGVYSIELLPELTSDQCERCDEIHNAALEFCKVLTKDPELQYDMAFIGEICDLAHDVLVREGHPVHYPSIVDEDGELFVQEWFK